ncbi:MAG TPA: ChbG/HpnK family deacetylase [Azospirillaceae bacterium]|nr:ChbG/HpnK family deacetylase [Azospirillaceae bacterium]
MTHAVLGAPTGTAPHARSGRAGIPFVLCADDYALSPGVSRAILDLLERGRLSATSCMSIRPEWARHASWLRSYVGRVDLGLHFTLTDHRPLGPMPRLAPGGRLPTLGGLLRLAFAGRLDPEEIAAELDRQLAAFVAHLGHPPDYVDGHQHVHQLPVVRDVLVRRLAGSGSYVRLCAERPATIVRRGVAVPKALFIAGLGLGLRRLLVRHGIRHNAGFGGVYAFDTRASFGHLFERFVHGIGPGALVMCHPGFPDDVLREVDRLVEPRLPEHRWLAGPGFRDLLDRHGLRLARLVDCGR